MQKGDNVVLPNNEQLFRASMKKSPKTSALGFVILIEISVNGGYIREQ